jgi:hypothetical protein
MTVPERIEVEMKIARALVVEAIAAGYGVGVHNGEEHTVKNSTDIEEIVGALGDVDEEHLIMYQDGKRMGWIFLVYGNSGWDVVCDYTTDLEEIVAKVQPLMDYCEEKYR